MTGEQVRAARVARGLTQSALAALCVAEAGGSESAWQVAITRWEAAGTPPAAPRRSAIIRALVDVAGAAEALAPILATVEATVEAHGLDATVEALRGILVRLETRAWSADQATLKRAAAERRRQK